MLWQRSRRLLPLLSLTRRPSMRQTSLATMRCRPAAGTVLRWFCDPHSSLYLTCNGHFSVLPSESMLAVHESLLVHSLL